MANDIDYEINPASALKAMRQIQQGQKELEQGVVGGAERMKSGWESLEKGLISVNDRQEASNRRLIRSVISRNDAYGKSPIQKVIQEQNELIKRLNLEGAALDKVTASYQRKIKAMEAEAGAGKGGGFFSSGGSGLLALRGARDLFEGRTAYGEVQIGKSLIGLGGTAAIIGGVTAAIIGLGVAGAEVTKSFASWGVEQTNIQQKLGLTAKELAQFQFAAKASGTDINTLERTMRGIASATEDFSPAGNKAREVFASIGFSLQDAQGKAKPFGQALIELSEAVEKIPPGTERAAFMIETLKRSGIESIPALHELAKAAKDFDQLKLAFPDQSTLDHARSINLELVEMGHNIGVLVLQAKEYVATGFMSTLHFLQSEGNSPNRTSPNFLDQEPGVPATPSAGYAAANVALKRLGSGGGGDLEAARQLETTLKSAADKALVQLQQDAGNKQIDISKVGQDTAAVASTNAEYSKQRDLVKNMEQADSRRLGAAEELLRIQKESYQITLKNQFGGTEAGKVIIEKKLSELELSDLTKKYPTNAASYQQESARRNRDFGLRYTFGFLADQDASRDAAVKLNQADQRGEQSRYKHLEDLPDLKDQVGAFTTDDRIAQIQLEARRSEITRQAGKATRLSELASGGDENAAIQQGYQIRIQLAQSLAAEEDKRIARELASIGDVNKAREDSAVKEKDLYAQLSQAADELQLKQLEVIHKQFESIKKEAEPLFTTLFTHPSKFGSQLGSTVRSAAIRPAVEGLSEITARMLQPLLHGADGKGGIADAMKFGAGPLADVRVDNGSLHVTVDNISGVGGKDNVKVSGGDITINGTVPGGGGGGIPGALGLSLPFLRAAGVGGGGTAVTSGISGIPSSFSTAFTGAGLFGGLGYGFGGGTAGDNFGGTSGASIGTFGGGGGRSGSTSAPLLRGLLGGFGKTGLSGLASNFGIGTDIIQTGSTATMGTTFGSVLNSKGTTGVEMAAGLPLAIAGLSGVRRGTGGGIAEAGVGGALVGASLGSTYGSAIGTALLPGLGTAAGAVLGAGIGAVGGLLAGGIEALVGDVSDRTKAKQQVQQAYHISISNKVADDIASIAKSKYGNNVSLAVHSPEVRQMLGLYAAGTGQAGKFPQSADIPHGGSLVNQGGVLQQSPVYQYGNPYTYQSNLPVAGGNPGGTLPAPGGSTLMSFNINGASTSSFLSGEVFTPENTSANMAMAYNNSNGRTAAAMALSDPTGTVG